MVAAPAPHDEEDRLRDLRATGVLDSMPEREFDDLVHLAAQICRTPIALVSLVDEHRQWFKARVGLDVSETPRDVAFCAHAVLQPDDLLVVPDAARDPRFQDNPLVSGEPRIRFYAGAPLVSADGKALGTLCVIDRVPRTLADSDAAALRALSRQVVAQLELRRQLFAIRRSRDVLARMPIGFMLLEITPSGPEPTLRIVDANPAAARLTGHVLDELIGARMDRVFPHFRAGAGALLYQAAVVERREIELGEIASGDVGHATFAVRAYPTPPSHVAVVFEDVTERSRATHALQESEARFRTLAEAATEGIAVHDGDIVLEANAALERMLRVAPGTLPGRRKDGFVDPRDRPRVAASVAQDETTALAVRMIRADGTAFDAVLNRRAILRDGRRLHVSVVRDNSEERRIERWKDELISTVSHELRTPLTSIRGSLGLLENSVAGVLPESAQPLIGIARANADRLARLIDDMLDLDKLTAGKLELDRTRVPTKTLLAAAKEIVEGMAVAAGVELQLSFEDDLETLADPARIAQVLGNLASNAIKHSPRGATVIIVARASAGGRTRFEVTDRGRGIAPADQERLFARFAQIDASDARRSGGTGLGLAISKAIVEEHGGSIGVESEPGNGATFWFELPRQADDEKHHAG